MFFRQLFARKTLEALQAEAQGENRLRRILGPVGLTSLGVGAIIGSGIFVMTGRVAAEDAGPAILLSYAIAGLGCALAALCYAEFASMAPVAGSAYTYAYATLGELIAWIIGWDLVLEYAMSCATVASAWAEYFNEFTLSAFNWQAPEFLSYDPFSKAGAWFNLLAVAIILAVTVVLVIGIRESAVSNTLLVLVKLGVVVFVIAVGAGYVMRANWTSIPPEERRLPEQGQLDDAVKEYVRDSEGLEGEGANARIQHLQPRVRLAYFTQRAREIRATLTEQGRMTEAVEARLTARIEAAAREVKGADQEGDLAVAWILERAREKASAPDVVAEKWGLIGELGLHERLIPIDEKTRSNFTPYGLSGIMLGAALVFFAFIGFDSISTHAEEAIRPARDVPIGIIASLVICTLLYIGVSAVITGMNPYPDIDTRAAVASAFRQQAEVENSPLLRASAVLIALGGLAGMTSVLLIGFLSQARIFLAMSRDGFLPPGVFAAVHEKFRTPHVSTMVTGAIMAVVAAFTPIQDLEKMVNIGTLFAFIIVCAAVLILRLQRPDAERPFRCPALFVVAPLGILVNLAMMLFLPLSTWLRLVIWLAIGLVIYFSYGYWHSTVGHQLRGEPPDPGTAAADNAGGTV